MPRDRGFQGINQLQESWIIFISGAVKTSRIVFIRNFRSGSVDVCQTLPVGGSIVITKYSQFLTSNPRSNLITVESDEEFLQFLK